MDTIFIDTGVGIKVPRLDAYAGRHHYVDHERDGRVILSSTQDATARRLRR